MSLAWAGTDRVGLWRIVAAIVIATAIDLVISLHTPMVVPPHPGAPSWLLALASSRIAVVVLALVAIVAAVASARPSVSVAFTAAWVVALALLAEAAAAVGPGPYRGWTFVGAVGTGIVVGRVWARLAVHDGADGRARFEARCGELGAVGSLVACYLGAATSKLGGAGLGWADTTTLHAVVLAHAHVDAPGLASLLHDAPWATAALGWATLVVQLGAVGLLLGTRARLVALVGLVGFHLGVAVLARIGYWSAVVLVLAVGLPWARWSGTREDDAPMPALDRRADTIVGVAIGVAIALAWLGPWRQYSERHHRSRTLDDGASASREALDRLGPVAVDDELEGWRVVAIEREPTRFVCVLDHADHPRAVLWISRRDQTEGGNSPFDRGALRISYEPPLPPAAHAAVQALARRLAEDPTIEAQLGG